MWRGPWARHREAVLSPTVKMDRSQFERSDMASKKRSARALGVDASLRASAEQMLESDETLTARALGRRAGLGAASSITRDPTRCALLDEFQEQQDRRRAWVQRTTKESTAQLLKTLAARDEQIVALTRKVQLLAASHKGMLLAVDEAGGTKAWARFFASYRDSIEALRELEALPAALGKPDIPSQAALARGAR
jgi:hypothetical protein